MAPCVGAINLYPIKSCRGVSVQSAMLTEAGLMFDREWMVVREDTGKFISQREKGLLALVEVALPPEALAAAHSGASKLPSGAAMTVTAPGMEPLHVPLVRRPDAKIRKVTVWEWTGAGADEGADAAAWFSRYLGVPCRLVRYLGSAAAAAAAAASTGDDGDGGASLPTVRTTEPEFAVDYETRFSDGYPMLLVTQAALADLNSKLSEPLPMNRFRPNLEVAGTDPWAEDGWRDVDVVCSADGRTLRLTSVKPCSRCKVTTINQATAEVGDEPLDTLGTIRSGKVLGWNKNRKDWTHSVFFGWNVVSRTPGVLSVGDALTVASPQCHDALVPAP
ncbi:hypothetical protein PLESTB_001027900 [Pleodorina starrii]|uniref:MOSC domain-containing protein n=1 Tax=Pleodorina starrii TaxID=330485 RepID=A0A9W6BPE1_9CHLO|nr:hypothetical protein PLESTM_001814200 [Pleodorina starrii]GLC55779.1 hypothetical protein PLESTB_001027900 [Pleodorina starrii]GLC68853.1 hypothetical protein PLESTF_000745600 [Pleodorina starrii]